MANYIEQYAAAIERGDIVTSDKVKRLYRHLVKKLQDTGGRYVFDEGKAKYVIEFIERFCKHSKGKWAGKPVLLELWQKAILSALFGFVDRKTGKRQYRELLLIVARKNGKSTLAAAIGVYLLVADKEPGPEIYSAATKRDQAKIIWSESVNMIRHSPALNKRCKCLVSKIRCNFNGGMFAPLASDTNNQDGLNIHGALIDELHAIKDKNAYDVLVDGMSAREQPICIITSTAGTVRDNIFDLKYEEGAKIVAGYGDPEGYHDETILPVMYELDKREEWVKPESWGKANPALGTVKDVEQLKVKVERAKANSIYVKNLLCKDFNVRETASAAFFTFEQLNNEATFDLEQLELREHADELYCKFTFGTGKQTTVPYDSIVHIRRQFNRDDVWGEESGRILRDDLSTLKAVKSSIVNAVNNFGSLRGILHWKSTLRPEDEKAAWQKFIDTYASSKNGSGIGSLDNKADFQQITTTVTTFNAAQMQFARDAIYRHFGLNDAIVTGKYTEDEYIAFYESVLEPLAVKLAQELTDKLFTPRERGFGNEIILETNRLAYMSVASKIKVCQALTPIGCISINEVREMFGYAGVEDGDERQVSLNYVKAGEQSAYQTGNTGGGDDNDEGDSQDDDAADAAQ